VETRVDRSSLSSSGQKEKEFTVFRNPHSLLVYAVRSIYTKEWYFDDCADSLMCDCYHYKLIDDR